MSTLKQVETELERVPPHDECAETSVIGSMLLDDMAAKFAANELTVEAFYLPRYQIMFSVFVEILQSRGTLDAVGVRDELTRRNLMERIGGRATIGHVLENTPSPANIELYCNIVNRHYRARQAILAAANVIESVRKQDEAGAAMAIQEAADRIAATENVQHATTRAIDHEISEEIAGRHQPVGIPGFPCLTSTFLTYPGNTGVLLGSKGTSKSLLSSEICWRMLFGAPGIDPTDTAILALESMANRASLHMRRVQAQIAGRAEITNPRWVMQHPDDAQGILRGIEDLSRHIEKKRMIQILKGPPTWQALLNWIRMNLHCRLLVIDPISKIDTGERGHIGYVQRRFLEPAQRMIADSGTTLLLVNHPPDTPPGQERTAGRMSGSKALENFTDCNVDLHAHMDKWDSFMAPENSPSQVPVSMSHNRTLHCTKVRVTKQRAHRIGYFLNSKTLCHEERGWIVDEC